MRNEVYVRLLWCRLAGWADMRAALADHQPLDEAAAARAGLPLATIYLKLVLELSAAVDPINAGSVALNALL